MVIEHQYLCQQSLVEFKPDKFYKDKEEEEPEDDNIIYYSHSYYS